MNISAGFLKGVFGSEKLAYNQLLQMVDKVLALYKILYVSIGDASLLKAFSALEYVFNVEAYFNIIGGSQGKTVFNNYRDDFLKRFNYNEIIDALKKGDSLMALYEPTSKFGRLCRIHGSHGKFRCVEKYPYWNNPHKGLFQAEEEQYNMVFVKLELSAGKVISLPVSEMIYLGKWKEEMVLAV